MGETLRQHCESPDPSQVVTVSDLAAYSVRQAGALAVCDKARGSLVALIDGQAVIAKPRKRFRWF